MIVRKARAEEMFLLPEIELDASQAFAPWTKPMEDIPPTPAEDYVRPGFMDAVFVAEENKDLLGFIAVRRLDSSVYIHELSVRFRASRQGVGTALLNQACAWAAQEGFEEVTLTTFRDIPFNGPFYQKNGFAFFEPDDKNPDLRDLRAREKAYKDRCDALAPRGAMRKNVGSSKDFG